MMMSLFSVFDPVVGGFQLNWMSMLVVFMFFPLGCKAKKFGVVYEVMVLVGVNKLFSEVSFPFYLGLSLVSSMVFFYLIVSNLLGLFPFVFTATSHPMMTMGVGVVCWISFVFMGWLMVTKSSGAHLVPEGAPIFLSPVLVIIELISHVIRPFTLSVRLAANMMAGHLIMGLMSMISLFTFTNFLLSVMMQSVLLILELAVAVIQGFVFSILILLYALDYYH